MDRQNLDDAMRNAIKHAETQRLPAAFSSTRFEIRSELGRGGTAVVYAAHDRKLGREVALKVLRDEGRTDPELAIRFRREAETAAKLSHPNIVTIFDVGWEQSRMVLVMELVKGKTLADAMDGGEFGMRRGVEILETVSRAVDFAHRAGVIHRDLKPGNILLTEEGIPKVADFGLARRMDSNTAITATGTTLGTPGYMAPEQAMGRSDLFSARTDVYALGATLYAILTGRAPHDGEIAADVVRRIVSEDPVPPRSLRPEIPADLEVIALKALEKEPSRRYPDAIAFADDLRRHLDGGRIAARPDGVGRKLRKWSRRHVATTAASAVAFAALLSLSAVLAVRTARKAAEARDLASRISSEQDPEKAVDLCLQLRFLDPDRAGIHDLLESLKAKVRRHKAQVLTDDGKSARKAVQAIELQLETLRARKKELLDAVDTAEHPERRTQLWQVESEVSRLERELPEPQSLFLNKIALAAETDPSFPEPRRMLAEFYWDAFLKAEWEGDAPRMSEARGWLRTYDPSLFRQSLEVRGSASIQSSPPGAAVEIFRYEEDADGRLAPRPATEPPTDLPGGSYLAVLKLPGRRDTRIPFAITRRVRDFKAEARMLTDDDIGAGFVHVPAGSYTIGEGSRREAVELPDLVFGRCEVTRGEYAEWLTALGPEEAKKRTPKFGWDKEGSLEEDRKNPTASRKMPVTEIEWKDARDYCRWRAERDHLPWRLPTSREWEAAGRGADARAYPWGNNFDWLWTNGGRTSPDPWPLPAGSTREDESPFGILDLAGNAKEWCADWQDKGANLRFTRGGSFPDTDSSEFCLSRSEGDVPTTKDKDIGFRIVRTVPPAK